jgi:hypothetical protein
VKKDPDERHNLAGQDAYQEILIHFRKKMEQWRQQQSDKETGIYVEGVKKGKIQYIFK